jgi:GAF domain-containing protein
MTEGKPKRSRSLAFNLATAFLRMSLIALIIAYIPQVIIFIQTDFNRIAAEQNAIANNAASQVANFIQEKFTDLELAASLVEPGTHTQEEQESVMTHLLAQQSSFRSVILLDTKGRELAHSTRFSQAEVDSLKQHVEALQLTLLEEDSQYVSPVYINEITSEPQIIMAVPVQDILGNQRGILLAEVNLKFMWDLVGGIQVGQTGFAFVINTNGDLLAHRDISRVLAGENLSQMVVVDQFLSGSVAPGKSVFSNFDKFDGKYGVASLVSLGFPNWAVVTYLPIAEAIRGLLINFATSFVFVLVLAGLTALFGVFIARRQAVPLVELTNVATSIAEGELGLTVTVQGPLEVQQLAQAFNTMTSRLREFITTLEQRVADRTKALATSSEVSRRLSTILNQKELVIEVVEQVKEAFGYYHAQIYLVEGDELVMAGGTGDAGAAMLAEDHKLPKGRGLVGRAAEKNSPVLVADTSKDQGWLPNPLLPETKSEVAIPISIGDQVLGVLDVQQDVADGLGQEDVDALQSIANQVAVAMQNINQYERTQKVAADLGVVADVGIATSTITEAGHLLQEVVDLSKRSFNLYHAHIYLLNETGDVLELAAGAGEVGRKMVAEGRQIPLNSEQSLVARAARTQEGVVVNDVQADPNFLPNPLLPKTRAEMAVPMLVSGKVIGVLDVQSEQVNRFTDTDVNIQTTLASQIAVALQNARSFTNAQKQAERETKLNLIAQKIQSTTTVEEAMQITARELGHALGKRQTLVALEPSALAGDIKGVATK